jgi:hypothetical protein
MSLLIIGLIPLYLSRQLKQMRQMTHENINTFVGACIDPPKAAILMGFCSRGSLQVSVLVELRPLSVYQDCLGDIYQNIIV